MKKVISTVLTAMLICLSLTACGGAEFSKRAEEYGYFHYPKADWGLTQDELISALGMSESDFTIEQNAGRFRDSRVLRYNSSFLGKECVVSFYLIPAPMADNYIFQHVTLRYSSATEQDYEEINKSLSEFVAAQCPVDITQKKGKIVEKDDVTEIMIEGSFGYDAYDSIGVYRSSRYVSQKMTSDLPKELKDAYNEYSAIYANKLAEESTSKYKIKTPPDGDFIANSPEALSDASIVYSDSIETQTGDCEVNIGAFGFGKVLAYKDALEKLNS